MRKAFVFAVVFSVVSWVGNPSAHAEIDRQDFQVSSEPDIDLFVRKVANADNDAGTPILLVHGARVGSLASFDVDVPGYSLTQSLADAGFTIYLADVRGYGRSTLPPSMSGDRFQGPPAVPTEIAAKDLLAVISEIRRRHPGDPLAAMGWATGSHWLAATEAIQPGSIDRLVFYNSVYGGEGPWRLTEVFAKEGAPSEFNYEKFGAYRTSDAKSLVGRWTQSEAISEAFINRYVEMAMEGDPTVSDRTPPSFRHPSGPIEDTLQAVHVGPLYDAALIRSDVLIVRSGKDFWSRPVDVERFQQDLTKARSVTIRKLVDASHYVHLEPGEGRDELLELVTDFIADGVLAN
ncbi:MAG: alpha/beta fold hydrolase [Pseudomonadota bacterium]